MALDTATPVADADDDDEGSGAELRFAVLLQTILQDAQTRLVFRAQAVVQSEVLHFAPSPADLDYPAIIVRSPGLRALWEEPVALGLGGGEEGAKRFRAPSEASQATWYPTLKRTVWVLSRLNAYVNVRRPFLASSPRLARSLKRLTPRPRSPARRTPSSRTLPARPSPCAASRSSTPRRRSPPSRLPSRARRRRTRRPTARSSSCGTCSSSRRWCAASTSSTSSVQPTFRASPVRRSDSGLRATSAESRADAARSDPSLCRSSRRPPHRRQLVQPARARRARVEEHAVMDRDDDRRQARASCLLSFTLPSTAARD